MADVRALVIKSGTQQQIPAADSLLVGSGIDASSGSGVLVIGGATATSITIGSALITTNFPGPVQLTGDVTTVGGTTFTSDATFEGNVTFGAGAADTVTFAALTTITSDIAFGGAGHRVTNMLDPSSAQDGATKAYADTKLALAGGTMSGAIAMASNLITGLTPGVAGTDAANVNQVNAIAAIEYDQQIFVAAGANPTGATGAPLRPFASVSAAMAAITDASPTKRYAIVVSAGAYTEATTTIAVGSNGQALPQGTINVASTTGFLSAGLLSVTTSSGVQTVTYTGTTSASTTVAVGSNGQALPQGTINVGSTASFLAAGTLRVTTNGGVQTVTYTGKTATSFTGCTGGAGTMSTGGAVAQDVFTGCSGGVGTMSTGGAVGAILALKPNVFIVGTIKDAVRITASAFVLDASFTGAADNRSGAAQVILIGAATFNFGTVTSSQGKLVFQSVSFNNAVSLVGFASVNQAQFDSCLFFSTFANTGVNVGPHTNNIHFSNITLGQSATASLATFLTATGGSCGGTFTALTTVNDFGRRISVFARSFYVAGAVTIDGPSSFFDHTVDSLPSAGASTPNGGNLVSIDFGANKNLSNLNYPTAVNNPIIPASTNATNLGDFNKQWFFSFGYLHASTGTDCYLASYPSSFGAEATAGKNVYAFADAAGLAANVNGGGVGLYSNTATGTGNSGSIDAETGTVVNGNSGDVTLTTGRGQAGAIAAGSNGQTLPSAVINVASVNGFPSTGTILVATNAGTQTVTYTGTTSASTTVAVGSNGQALPQGTINVGSTASFLAAGTLRVTTNGGVQTVTYTGKTATSFTGCTGGAGTMSTGGAVAQDVFTGCAGGTGTMSTGGALEFSGIGTRGVISLNGRQVDVNSTKIVNLADGTNPNDAVNFSQLSALVTGVSSFQTSLSGLTPSSATGGAITLAGTLGVTSGGTGATSLTSGSLLAGNGAGTVAEIAPGSNGQVLTVVGGAWVSAAVPAAVDYSVVSITTAVSQGDAVTVAGTAAIATAAASARVAGMVSATANKVSVLGIIEDCNFEGSLTLAVGEAVYLSASSAGKLTNMAPLTVTQVVAELGIIAVVNTVGGGAAAADVIWQPKSIVVL